MDIFKNGTFANGEPAYQIGTKNKDGEYDIVVFEVMTDVEAKAKLAELQPAKKPAKKPTKKPAKIEK